MILNYIVEFEQNSGDRAKYSNELLQKFPSNANSFAYHIILIFVIAYFRVIISFEL